MDILHSNWLVKMLEKSSKTPHDRLLSLFDILDDWLNAPQIIQNQAIQNQIIENLDVAKSTNNNQLLLNYLSTEAKKAGAALPDMLANQLYFMALAAVQEKLHNHQNHHIQHYNNLNGDQHISSLKHAKNAANALINAQTKNTLNISISSVFGIAASFVGALVVAGSVYAFNINAQKTPLFKQLAQVEHLHIQTKTKNNALKNLTIKNLPIINAQYAEPEQTAALIAQIDQMRKGNCQLIEALQLPDSYKKVYFENIVMGQISTDPTDQKLVLELLQKVRCNYTPMLMAHSK